MIWSIIQNWSLILTSFLSISWSFDCISSPCFLACSFSSLVIVYFNSLFKTVSSPILYVESSICFLISWICWCYSLISACCLFVVKSFSTCFFASSRPFIWSYVLFFSSSLSASSARYFIELICLSCSRIPFWQSAKSLSISWMVFAYLAALSFKLAMVSCYPLIICSSCFTCSLCLTTSACSEVIYSCLISTCASECSVCAL